MALQLPSWMPRVLFESALIVFSVLLALALDEWRETRKQQSRTSIAVEAIAAELRNNRDAVDRARQRHERMNKELNRVLKSGTPVPMALAYEGTFNPATAIVDSAWISARETGAIDALSYDLVLELARTYQWQANYRALGSELAADLYKDLRRLGMEQLMQQSVAGMVTLTFDFTNRERTLIERYDRALDAITRR